MASLSLDLTFAMTTVLEQVVSSPQSGSSLVYRAQCVLLADGKRSMVAIASSLQKSVKTVSRWMHRFAESLEALRCTEQSGVKAALKRQIIDCLRDAPRSGAPKKFTPSQVASLISIACEDPEKSGRPVTSWTTAEIVDEAVLRNGTFTGRPTEKESVESPKTWRVLWPFRHLTANKTDRT